jgi:hypothetical protein
MLFPLTDLGRLDEALEAAARVAGAHEAAEPSLDLWGVRAAQARILTMRGRAAEATGWLDGLESSTPGAADFVVLGLGASALVRAATGDEPSAASLLNEIARSAAARGTEYYAQFLPALVRTALATGDSALAERLTADVDGGVPYHQHAFVVAIAALTEARGGHDAAALGYADAAGRWGRFGVVPERAFALLGEGRCLVELNRAAEAVPVLREARGIFAELGAAPALAETDALLQKAIKVSS